MNSFGHHVMTLCFILCCQYYIFYCFVICTDVVSAPVTRKVSLLYGWEMFYQKSQKKDYLLCFPSELFVILHDILVLCTVLWFVLRVLPQLPREHTAHADGHSAKDYSITKPSRPARSIICPL
jgi:hypothetical protein